MKPALTALICVTAAAAALLLTAPDAYGRDQCAELWRGQQWHEVEQPIWVSPSAPDRVVPKLQMWSLEDGAGNSFVPGNIEESNCFLDRILDRTTRSAIKRGGSFLASVSRPDLDADLDRLLYAVARRLDAAIGVQQSSPAGTLTSIFINLQSLYGIPARDPGPFLRHAYSQRLYNDHTLTWYVLLAYEEHLGVIRPAHLDAYVQQLRARDAKFAPPDSLRAEGCVIDYTWPHMGQPLSDQTEFPEYSMLHFGVCPATGNVWYYYIGQGWRPLSDQQQAEFCEDWSRDEAFSSTCERSPQSHDPR